MSIRSKSPGIALTVVFEADLPLADMKARLVLNRVSSRARVLAHRPARGTTRRGRPAVAVHVFLVADCDPEELRALADVEGVAEVRIEPGGQPDGTEAASIPPPATALQPVPARPDSPPNRQPRSRSNGSPPQSPCRSRRRWRPRLDRRGERRGCRGGRGDRGDEPPGGPKANGPKKARIAETIRVESDRLDHLMNLAGELVITKARFVAITRGLEELFRGSNAHALASDTRERLDSVTRGLEALAEIKAGTGPGTTSSGGSPDRWSGHVRRLRENFRAIQDELVLIREAREQIKALSEAIHSLGRVSDGLQKGVLDTRMVPIGPLFERFRRVIRDLSHSSGKEVFLQIGGEKTELDKRMIDELSDPLIHMVRNAVDHGLEPPDRREAAGKPRGGTVSLLASHRGNSVVITVSDDGRGIDCERIRQKIVAKGLVGKAEARELSDRELVAYIWHPGLSTAETITEISGRGVGMDIVKSRIENLNGAVDVRSVLGQGTTFIIRLPLTLAIMSSLLVRIYDEIYAIPLDHIDEIVEVRSEPDLPRPGPAGHRDPQEDRRPGVARRRLPVGRPGAPLGSQWIRTTGEAHAAAEDASDKRTVVVVQNGETTIGLIVDQLIGMQEVVLKSLEKNFQSIPGLSGASILGDGRVSLILDLDAVIDMVARLPARLRE